MKTLFGMTAAVLLVVTMLFVSLPGNALAEKVTAAEMVKIKKAADEAAQAAKAQLEKARTDEEKLLAKWLVKQAEINAEVAGELLEAVKAGEDVSRQDVAFCAAIAKAVNEAAAALAAGDMAKAEDVLDRIAELGSSLPTAANARAEMQKADGAVRNQVKIITWWPAKCIVNSPLRETKFKCIGIRLVQIDNIYICVSSPFTRWKLLMTSEAVVGLCRKKHAGEILACTCTGGGGWALGAPMNLAARFAFDRNCVNGQVVEDSCYNPSPSVPHNCPCPAPAR